MASCMGMLRRSISFFTASCSCIHSVLCSCQNTHASSTTLCIQHTHRIHLWATACRSIIGHHDTSQQTSNRKMSTFHRLTTSCCARNKNIILRRHSPASVHTCPTCIVHWDYYTPGFETVARQCLVCCTAAHQNLTVETCWVSGTC